MQTKLFWLAMLSLALGIIFPLPIMGLICIFILIAILVCDFFKIK
jgi:hypothetical protein